MLCQLQLVMYSVYALCIAGIPALGQTYGDSDSSMSRSSNPNTTIGLFTEFGGYMPSVVSANADILFTIHDRISYSQLGLRIGYSFSFYNYQTIPVSINGSFGRSHRFEYGAGVIISPFGVPLEYGEPAFDLSQTAFKIGAHMGWRFDETDGGWLIRGTLTSLYDTGNQRFFPFFGISLGYQFQY